LSQLKNLQSLQLKRNKIGINGLSDLQGLIEIQSLTSLDLSDNLIDDEAVESEILMKMPNLAVLYFQNNPVCKKISNYRKSLIRNLPNLKFLDDRPVFPEDRRYVVAFFVGGLEAEREERKKYKQE